MTVDMNNDWETRVQNAVRAFPYPPTPDIAARLKTRSRVPARRYRRLAAAALIVVIGLASLLAVPEIRAQVLAFFRIGVVEVIVTTATPASFSSGDLPESVLRFPGETTLEDAQQRAGYPIRLPSALGAPDRVYLIQASSPIVVLAWLNESNLVDYSLHLLPLGTYSLKMYDGPLEETEVNGERALWLPNPHWYMLRVRTTPDQTQLRRVTAHALIWETQNGTGITYRLETNHTLEDAQRIAESLPTGND